MLGDGSNLVSDGSGWFDKAARFGIDVIIDGSVVFSRQQAGRFPTAEGIVESAQRL